MINIAICDDDVLLTGKIETMLNIMVRQSRLSGVARATCPD